MTIRFSPVSFGAVQRTGQGYDIATPEYSSPKRVFKLGGQGPGPTRDEQDYFIGLVNQTNSADPAERATALAWARDLLDVAIDSPTVVPERNRFLLTDLFLHGLQDPDVRVRRGGLGGRYVTQPYIVQTLWASGAQDPDKEMRLATVDTLTTRDSRYPLGKKLLEALATDDSDAEVRAAASARIAEENGGLTLRRKGD